MLNLGIHARDAVPNGVSAHDGRRCAPATVESAAKALAGRVHVRFIVADTGGGISSGIRPSTASREAVYRRVR